MYNKGVNRELGRYPLYISRFARFIIIIITIIVINFISRW